MRRQGTAHCERFHHCFLLHSVLWMTRAAAVSAPIEVGCCPLPSPQPRGPRPNTGSGWEPRRSLSTRGEALRSLILGVWSSLVNSSLVMFWRPGFRHKNSHVSRLFAPGPQSCRRGCLMDRTHTRQWHTYETQTKLHTHFTGLHMSGRENYIHTPTHFTSFQVKHGGKQLQRLPPRTATHDQKTAHFSL